MADRDVEMTPANGNEEEQLRARQLQVGQAEAPPHAPEREAVSA